MPAAPPCTKRTQPRRISRNGRILALLAAIPLETVMDNDAPVRVPQITLWFWIAKILTTGAGETTSDYLGHTVGDAVVVVAGLLATIGALVLQFRMKRYVAWTYWLATSMIAIFGTM